MVFVTNLVLGILVVFLNLEANEIFLAICSWEKKFELLIRTHWEGLSCEHTKI